MKLRQEARELYGLTKATLVKWIDDDVSTHAASLAYFTVFSIAPTLVIAIAVASRIFGAEAARGEIQAQIAGLVGPAGAQAIEAMMASSARPGTSLFASTISTVVLLFGATGVFAALQSALNHIWGVKPRPGNSVLLFLRVRFLSFAMVLGTGFLLLVSLVAAAGISALGKWMGGRLPGLEPFWQTINFFVSFAIVGALFAMIYKVLPDVPVAWRDVRLGAAVTAVLFSLGNLVIGLYLGKSGVASGYGAAGSLVALLVWVYYSSLVLFLGAEFTQVSARAREAREALPAPEAESAAPELTASR